MPKALEHILYIISLNRMSLLRGPFGQFFFKICQAHTENVAFKVLIHYDYMEG